VEKMRFSLKTSKRTYELETGRTIEVSQRTYSLKPGRTVQSVTGEFIFTRPSHSSCFPYFIVVLVGI
jgi:hypothetical protein